MMDVRFEFTTHVLSTTLCFNGTKPKLGICFKCQVGGNDYAVRLRTAQVDSPETLIPHNWVEDIYQVITYVRSLFLLRADGFWAVGPIRRGLRMILPGTIRMFGCMNTAVVTPPQQ